jgi:hypothetical protein
MCNISFPLGSKCEYIQNVVDQQQIFGEVICIVTKLFFSSCEHGIFFEDNTNLKGFENV